MRQSSLRDTSIKHGEFKKQREISATAEGIQETGAMPAVGTGLTINCRRCSRLGVKLNLLLNSAQDGGELSAS
jgi:hypothetical protein